MNQNPLEKKLNRQEILSLIANVSHQTWMKQANRDKGKKMDELPKEISDDDKERAQNALELLENSKPKTRQDALNILAKSSHDLWLDFRRKQGSEELVRLEPEPHDFERSEDIVSALEAQGFLSF